MVNIGKILLLIKSYLLIKHFIQIGLNFFSIFFVLEMLYLRVVTSQKWTDCRLLSFLIVKFCRTTNDKLENAFLD